MSNQKTEKETQPTIQVQQIVSCKLCGKRPGITPYRTDESGCCSRKAIIACECGNIIVVETENYITPAKISSWESCKIKWKKAAKDAILKWNVLNS